MAGSRGRGTPRPLTTPVPGVEISHRWPHLLPGGRAAVFSVMAPSGREEERTSKPSRWTPDRAGCWCEARPFPRYLPTGHLLYARGGALHAAPFDPDRLELTGPPVAVLGDVWCGPRRRGRLFRRLRGRNPGLRPRRPSHQDHRSLCGRIAAETPSPCGFRRAPTPSPRSPPTAGASRSPSKAPRTMSTSTTWPATPGRASPSTATTAPRPGPPRAGARVHLDPERAREHLLDACGRQRTTRAPHPQPQLAELRLLRAGRQGPGLHRAARRTASDVWMLPLDGDRAPRPLVARRRSSCSPPCRRTAGGSPIRRPSRSRRRSMCAPSPERGRKWAISREGGSQPVWSPTRRRALLSERGQDDGGPRRPRDHLRARRAPGPLPHTLRRRRGRTRTIPSRRTAGTS